MSQPLSLKVIFFSGNVAVCALYVTLTPQIVFSQEQENLKQQFVSQAPEKWSSYIAKCARLQGTIRVAARLFDVNCWQEDRSNRRTEEFEIRQSPDAALLRRQRDNGGGEIQAINPEYSFSLLTIGTASVHAPKPSATVWQALSVLDKWDTRYELLAPVRDRILPWAAFPAYFDRSPLPSLLTRKRFSIKEISSVKDNSGRALVRVDVEFSCDKGEGTSRAWMILDPERYWCLREYWAKGSNGGVYSGVLEWKTEDSDPPVLRRAQLLRPPENGTQYKEELISILNRVSLQARSSSFRSSDFGSQKALNVQFLLTSGRSWRC